MVVEGVWLSDTESRSPEPRHVAEQSVVVPLDHEVHGARLERVSTWGLIGSDARTVAHTCQTVFCQWQIGCRHTHTSAIRLAPTAEMLACNCRSMGRQLRRPKAVMRQPVLVHPQHHEVEAAPADTLRHNRRTCRCAQQSLPSWGFAAPVPPPCLAPAIPHLMCCRLALFGQAGTSLYQSML